MKYSYRFFLFITLFPSVFSNYTCEKITSPYRCNLYKRKIKSILPSQAHAPQRNRAQDALLNQTIRDMSLQQLREAKKYAMQIQTDKFLIIQYIERMILLSTDQKELETIRFELANLYFDLSNMKKSSKLFHEYIRLYPGSKKRDEAEYKEILSRFHARTLPPRDQSKTKKVLLLANNYLLTDSITRSHMIEVQDIQKTCLHDLFAYEYDIVYQYIIRKKYSGAQTRITYIYEELIKNIPEKQPQLLELEIALDQAKLPQDNQENQELIKQKIVKLSTNWPDHKPTLIAYGKSKSIFNLF